MISLFTILLIAIILSTLLIALTLFGDSPNVRNTWVNKLHINVLWSFRRISRTYDFIDKYFNNNLLRYLSWLIPIFYFTVLSYCLHSFFTKTFHILPQSIQQSYGHRLCIFIMVSMIYTSFIQCIFSNPGRINKRNVTKANAIFENNNIIFFNGKTCPTCQLIKPARSKHCSSCNSCVLLFDHHCIWVNNCIGYYNYKWFLAYLISNIEVFVYGFYLCLTALNQGKDNNYSYWKTITSTSDTNKITGVFVILCFIFCILTSIFTGLHMRYIYLGVTTNELEKWSEIEYLIELGVLYENTNAKISDERYLERAIINESGTYTTVYVSLKNEKVVFNEAEIEIHSLRKLSSIEKDIINIYDKGFWNNLRERIIPIHCECY